MAEEWRRIPGWPDYEVSNLGGVRSWRPYNGMARGAMPRVINGSIDQDGYVRVTLRGNDTRPSKIGVHALVLLAFCGPCPEAHEPSHLDDNPANNGLDNLIWEPRHLNNMRRYDHGRAPMGEDVKVSKLTVADVLAIRSTFNGARGQLSSLGRLYGVSRTTIKQVVSRGTWRRTT